MAAQMWIRQMLEQRNVQFQELHHTEAYTAQTVAQREHVSGHRVAKVVVAIVDEQPVELVLPASRHVNLDLVCRVVNGRKARLAGEEEMAKFFTDCDVGAVPPLRHWANVPVVMDRSLNVEGDILFQAGTHTDAIRLNFRDWYELVRPQVATFSEPAELAHA
jgi:Ala-tRNA(Pro) deacylase